MLTVKEKGLLLNIIKYCQRISEKVNQTTKKKFLKDDDLIEIVCFGILQIGELSKNFDATFLTKYNKVPWKQIAGMRDKVAHGYGTIDIDKVWNTASYDIAVLENYCNSILENNK